MQNPQGFQASVNASPQSAAAAGATITDVQHELRGISQSLDQLAVDEANHGGLPPPAQQGEELSFYALDIGSISDLIQQQNLLQYQHATITTLRVMHCENFCNINGIQIKMFQSIVELNLSSNNLSDISELSVLKNVRNLNLSCNKITQVQGLDGMIGSLRRIVLSHNRIASLQYFSTIIENG